MASLLGSERPLGNPSTPPARRSEMASPAPSSATALLFRRNTPTIGIATRPRPTRYRSQTRRVMSTLSRTSAPVRAIMRMELGSRPVRWARDLAVLRRRRMRGLSIVDGREDVRKGVWKGELWDSDRGVS